MTYFNATKYKPLDCLCLQEQLFRIHILTPIKLVPLVTTLRAFLRSIFTSSVHPPPTPASLQVTFLKHSLTGDISICNLNTSSNYNVNIYDYNMREIISDIYMIHSNIDQYYLSFNINRLLFYFKDSNAIRKITE